MKSPTLHQLADVKLLTSAWQSVQAKGAAGGIDQISLEDYKKNGPQNLQKLSENLRNRTWKPQPYLGIQVPKKTEGVRNLGLLSVEDKIVQQGIKMLIEPLIEQILHPATYAYRPGKGHCKALRRALHECRQAQNNVYVRLDIKDFFDTIDRDILIAGVSGIVQDESLVSLIRLCISMGRVNQAMAWEESQTGIPQGAVLSPLLANLYLTPFDHFMESVTNAYIRYADDCVCWIKERTTADALLQAASAFLAKELHLSLNQKTEVGETELPMTFLGVDICRKGLSLSLEKRRELEEQLMQVSVSDGALAPSYLKTLDGIRQYYAKVLPEEYGILMDGWLRRAVQTYITSKRLTARQASPLFHALDGFTDKETVRNWIKEVARNEQQKTEIQRTIASRKREYQRLESENSELAITSPGCFIGLSGRGLTLRKNGQPMKIPPTAALKHISILSQGVSISSNAIAFCMEAGIAIDYYDMHAQHLASILSPRFMLTSLWKVQAELPQDVAYEIGRRIILGKVKNQYSLAKYFNKYHKNVGMDGAFANYRDAVENLLGRISGLKKDTADNFRQRLMSYEAASAVVYWEYVRELILDDIDGFYSRVKQGATDLVNSLLNYGYAILYPRIWQTALKYKLNPYCGFVHYAEGNANLVFDMIELFRAQAVDRVVITLIQKKEPLKLKNGKLDDATKKKLISSILERLNRKENYRGEMHSLVDIIDAQFRELVVTMTSGSAYRPYLAKW